MKTLVIDGIPLTPAALAALNTLIVSGANEGYIGYLDEIRKFLLSDELFDTDAKKAKAYGMLYNIEEMRDTFVQLQNPER
ncbi:MAG: hypothetical protein WCJ03_03150 [Bacteroidales bacterium]